MVLSSMSKVNLGNLNSFSRKLLDYDLAWWIKCIQVNVKLAKKNAILDKTFENWCEQKPHPDSNSYSALHKLDYLTIELRW